MFEFNPRRQVHAIGTEFVSFPILTRSFVWPPALAQQLQAAQKGAALPPEVEETLREHLILRQRDPDDQIFPLREVRPGGWANSTRGQAIVEGSSQAMTVLDALSWSDLSNLPGDGAYLYLGDGHGGFYASETRSRDGKIPCPRCLTLRYLAGRKALPKLYQALQEGATVAFAQPEQEKAALQTSGLTLFGAAAQSVEAVLPLADCPTCLDRSRVREFEAHPMAPVISEISLGDNHAAHLPQMLWLTGHDTVGSGGAFDPDAGRGRARARNEALERYAAHFLPTDCDSEGLPFQTWDEPSSTHSFSLRRTLLSEPGSLSTGLACRESLDEAVADGLQEVCERDALARFWLGLEGGGARFAVLGEWSEEGLTVTHYLLDSYHHPTVLCLARTDAGQIASGSACGPLEQARAKAQAECLQNVAYLRTYAPAQPADPPESFLDHAALYWHGLRELPDLEEGPPLSPHGLPARPLPAAVFYRDLTPPDLALTGLHAVRVVVPGLLVVPMSHLDWPSVLAEADCSQAPPQTPHPFL